MRMMAAVLAATVMVGPSFSVAAAPPVDADVQVTGGATVVGSFFSIDGCVAFEVIIFANESRFKQGPGGLTESAGGELLVIETDSCTGEQTFELGVIDPIHVAASGTARFRLEGTAVVSEFYSGAERTLTLDLVFVGTGPVVHENSHFNVISPFGRTVYHGNFQSRTADVTGVVSTADGANLVEGDTGSGTIDWSRQGALQLITAP